MKVAQNTYCTSQPPIKETFSFVVSTAVAALSAWTTIRIRSFFLRIGYPSPFVNIKISSSYRSIAIMQCKCNKQPA